MVRLKAFAAINSASLGPHGRGAETAEALEMRILGAFESALNHARLGKLDQAEVCVCVCVSARRISRRGV